jgi:hypothetical protein
VVPLRHLAEIAQMLPLTFGIARELGADPSELDRFDHLSEEDTPRP